MSNDAFLKGLGELDPLIERAIKQAVREIISDVQTIFKDQTINSKLVQQLERVAGVKFPSTPVVKMETREDLCKNPLKVKIVTPVIRCGRCGNKMNIDSSDLGTDEIPRYFITCPKCRLTHSCNKEDFGKLQLHTELVRGGL